MRRSTPCRGCTSSSPPPSTPGRKSCWASNSQSLIFSYFCSKLFNIQRELLFLTRHSLMSPLLSSTKGCLRSFRREFFRSSRHLWSSFRCWAQLCSERHCPSLVRNWTTARRTTVNWTAMLLPCCSPRCAICRVRLHSYLFWDIYKNLRVKS